MAGDTPELLLDESTGSLSKVHFFVTTMGFSSYLYAGAFLDEKTPGFVAGTAHALSFYGEVPEQLVPDNCKVAVSKHTPVELSNLRLRAENALKNLLRYTSHSMRVPAIPLARSTCSTSIP